jgi:lipopolysaccharide transport system ATP-binding protein
MSDTVIKVENLSKKYIIRHQQAQQYTALRDVVADGVKSIGRRLTGAKPDPSMGSTQEEFWALKDVSFEVKQGDRIGIIGRNGAGKSTLLKILSRITEPTKGEVMLNGRVASLLEVGTGFHPELTGRENIYLNGAILGMGKTEIKKKFDEIVAFAEVKTFLDTPVKRYSSGMYVRLAFAVAAHLETEILIIDEVLAVGDTQFQKKCLGKIEDLGKNGRTVLFVSHNMAAVEKLCENGILLRQGEVIFSGSKSETITQYLSNTSSEINTSLEERKDRQGNGLVKISKIEIKDIEGNFLEFVNSGQTIDIYFYFENFNENTSKVIASFVIKTQLEIPVFLQHSRLTGNDFGKLSKTGIFVARIYDLPLPSSVYQLSYSLIQDGICLDSISDAITLTVIDGDFFGSGEVPPISHGVSLVRATWRLE